MEKELPKLTADLIRELTADNSHHTAHKIVAAVSGYSAAASAFEALDMLIRAEGELQPDVHEVSERWRKKLKAYIVAGHGGERGKQAWQCL